MTLLSRAKAMQLPGPAICPSPVVWPYKPHFTAGQLRAAREQIAAEGDEVIGRLCEALELIANTDPVDAVLDPQRATEIARAALAEARKA